MRLDMAIIGNDLAYAISILKQNKPVAIPTETVYGLAANAYSSDAIETIFSLKKRPKNRTLALNIHPSWDILQWVENPAKYVNSLINTFWPGPLTIILPARQNCLLPALIGPNQSVALRCPNHPITLQLLHDYASPLIAPSANPSDDLSACSAEAVYSFFQETDLYILDGQASKIGLESTILQATDDAHYHILRLGAITLDAIEQCIGFKATSINHSQTSNIKTNRYYFKDINEIKALCQQQPILIASKETIALFPMLESHVLSIKDFYSVLGIAKSHPKRMILVECNANQEMALQDRIKKFCHPLYPETGPTLSK
jgi:L-threonylcarbamoyladenylate synthase